MLLIHARMARWSPQIFKDTLKHWTQLRAVVPQDIFASPQVHDAKWEKFVSAFGFVPLIDAAPCNDGQTRPIWINYGKLNHPNSSLARPRGPHRPGRCRPASTLLAMRSRSRRLQRAKAPYRLHGQFDPALLAIFHSMRATPTATTRAH
jgi:hypothetical protein